MGNRPEFAAEAAAAVKEMFRDEVDWELFEDMDRATNVELWHGPLGAQYWADPDPGLTGTRYQWQGFEQACEDMTKLLEPLPHKLWWDADSDTLSTINPDDDENNWWTGDDNEFEDDPVWVGGDNWWEFSVRQVLMYDVTFSHIFGSGG